MGRSVTLSRKPPSLRAASPASSIYSNYSFYQMDSSTPSPTGSTHFLRDSPTGSNQNLDSASGSRARTPLSNEPKRRVAFQTPSTSPSSETGTAQSAQEYLQLGITHHEANRLRESAICFERSAVVGGGCGVGMLMYGLTLRHGWGCEKNEKTGFKWLRKAAEAAVDDLESARNGGSIVGEGSEKLKTGDEAAVQNELILAIYEVGQCFFHGWGVAKDQKMGVSYYQVAARLGDADAQCDLAFCLANGKGCKKDRKTAAKWYRAAVAQGQSDIGLAWIYKEKFQD
ncbi:HCP-like protein [Mycena floridula]|nr:HCP-like protein [Mycena floridula]